jgi:CBS domain containing-hemolysin-like protein
MDDPFIYGLLVLLLLLFLILKSAFNSVNEIQLELDKKKANYHSKILSLISRKTNEFSVANTILYYSILTILVILLRADMSDLFQHFNTLLFFLLFGFVIGLIVFPFIIIIPKTLGEYFPNEIINLFAVFLMTIYILVFPILKIALFLSNTTLNKVDRLDLLTNRKTDFSKDDLNKFVSDIQKHSLKNEDINSEIRLFQNALDFADIKVRECMIPRNEITAIEINNLEELKAKFIFTGYSKILVFKDSIEDIVGFINSKSLFNMNLDLRNEIKSIQFFPETMPASKLLHFFIKSGQKIVAVVDEFGGISGIITIEDILEEIFGEMKDEHDSEDLFEKKLSEKDFVFSGRLEIDYINEKYEINIPENEEYETLAGYILNHTESFPGIKDQITIEQFRFTILKVSETRVDLVKLEILSSQA